MLIEKALGLGQGSKRNSLGRGARSLSKTRGASQLSKKSLRKLTDNDILLHNSTQKDKIRENIQAVGKGNMYVKYTNSTLNELTKDHSELKALPIDNQSDSIAQTNYTKGRDNASTTDHTVMNRTSEFVPGQ